MNALAQVVHLLEAKAKQPGVMSLAGLKAERRARRFLASYFKVLGERFTAAFNAEMEHSPQSARTHATITAQHVVTALRAQLESVLRIEYADAMLAADRQGWMIDHFKEAEPPLDAFETTKVGLTAEQAAEYAAKHAAEQVKGVDETTVQQIADAVENAILTQRGPAGLSRDLRLLFDSMAKDRADMIARTEMADAFAQSALLKFDRLGIEYAQLINSPDACDECVEIADQGPMPVDEIEVPPIHPNCRCAIVGARAPEDSND